MAGPKKGPVERVEARSVLHAVLLADSFTQRFRPITIERPKVLLPLVNVPMIEYTLEWLAMNKVEETFVFCCAHADQISKYLSESKWGSSSGASRQMRVTPIISTNCMSAGEAMRVIDQRDIIKSDFILVSGDTISNMDLSPVLEAHKARRAADKNAIMTLVMKTVNHPNQRLRLGEYEALMCMDPATHRLLKYQEMEGASMGAKSSGTIKVDASFFSERDNIQVRTDLVDTHISICTPEVLMLFSDNFDYQNIKKDFVSGVLSEEELGNKLYVHELGREYAAYIHNLRSYDAVSRDILQRWSFPFVPDTNVLQRGGAWGAPTYRYGRGHVYCEQQVQVPRSAVLSSDVCVGAGTNIGEGCQISQSVIGRNCRIGKNVTITGSYLHDSVTIQDNVTLRSAMVCENALISSGALVDPGAIISFGVVIGAGHRVAANKRISLCRQVQGLTSLSDDDLEYTASGRTSTGGGALSRGPSGRRRHHDESDSDDGDDAYDDDGAEEDPMLKEPSAAAVSAASTIAMGRSLDPGVAANVQFDQAAVGPGGAGYSWLPNEGFDVERYGIAMPNISKILLQENELDMADASLAGAAQDDEDSSGSDEDEDQHDPETVFMREVSETFLRCVKMRFEEDNAVLELNGLKIAEDRTFAECARYIFTTMLSLCLPATPFFAKGEYASLFPKEAPDTSTQEGKLSLLRAFTKQLNEWRTLLQRFLKNEDDQVELLLTFEEFCGEEDMFEGRGKAAGAQGSPFAVIFAQILKQLYDADVLSEEALLAWADEKEHADEDDRLYLTKAAKFIEWLRESDEEDEDEEDDEKSD